jgi:hypothetical protein
MNKNSSQYKFLRAILIVFAIVAIILTIGWIINETGKKRTIAEPDEEDEKLPDAEAEKKKLETRLGEIDSRIKSIQNRKFEIAAREKKIFISARLTIGVMLVALNALYIYFTNWPFKLDAQLNVNGAILLVYSFFAFITYGTPTRFINALKTKIAYFLKKKHIDIMEELEPLKVERETTMLQLESYLNPIEVMQENSVLEKNLT